MKRHQGTYLDLFMKKDHPEKAFLFFKLPMRRDTGLHVDTVDLTLLRRGHRLLNLQKNLIYPLGLVNRPDVLWIRRDLTKWGAPAWEDREGVYLRLVWPAQNQDILCLGQAVEAPCPDPGEMFTMEVGSILELNMSPLKQPLAPPLHVVDLDTRYNELL